MSPQVAAAVRILSRQTTFEQEAKNLPHPHQQTDALIAEQIVQARRN
jgi:hypothetical protein